MSETMYMKKLTRVVSDNKSENNTNLSSTVEDTLEDNVFSDPDGEINPNIRTKLQYEMDINGSAYKTDLGSTITRRSKLTLRDLGTHMSERMLKAMSQDNVNLMDPLYISGFTENSTSQNVENILKKFSSSMDENNWVTKKDSDASALLNDIEERYGDYVSDISNWRNYAYSSPGIGMGDANVLNPPFQFNEIDDVRSDLRRPKIGRMYSEEIYDYNMPIVYFQPGTISINTSGIKLASAFVNTQTINYQNYLRGEGNPIKWGLTKFGNLMQSIVSFGAKIILDSATWYKWTPTVFRYMRFVNEIILELAAWMGLLNGIYEDDNTAKDYHDYEEAQKENKEDTSLADMMDANSGGIFKESEGMDNKDADTYQNVGYEHRDGYIGGVRGNILSVLRILPQFKYKIKEYQDKKANTDDNTDVGTGGWPLAMLTIPFAIDKGASSSESFSNSSQEHPIRQQYNDLYEESNQARMVDLFGNPIDTLAKEGIGAGVTGFKDWIMDKGGAIWDSAKQYLGDKAQNALAAIGLSSEAGMVASGLGRFLLPEVWTDSQFDKSYSISMKFRSPYGHRLSVFENDFIPLSFLIGLTAPRKIGIQSYTNPFYVRVYSKGLFSIPMGMVTSMSITRGEDSNDRTVEGFFRTTSVQIAIKDMMPNVAMGLDGGIFSLSKATNLGMENYLCTLAGIDFIERASITEIFKNKWSRIKNMARSVNLFGEYGKANRSNLWMLIARGTIPGKFMSRLATKLGKSENPFATRKPKSYY